MNSAVFSRAVCDPPQHLPPRRWRITRNSGLAIAALFAVLAVSWADGALQRHTSGLEKGNELVYVPPSAFLRIVSLRYEHALADVLWFRTINYFGRHYRTDRVYPWLAYMCDVVTDLDPQAEHVYRFGGVILPWEAERVDEGIALLEKGTRNMAQSWRLHYMLGFSYYFFKDDLRAASRALGRAVRLSDAPPFVGSLAALVHAADRGPGSAIDFLSELERSGGDDELRGVIRQRIRELTLSAHIDTLETVVRRFEERHARLPLALGDLVSAGLLPAIPAEPFGGRYLLDAATGRVHSSLGHEPVRLGSSAVREAILRGQRSPRE